jgi:hypothetical protein
MYMFRTIGGLVQQTLHISFASFLKLQFGLGNTLAAYLHNSPKKFVSIVKKSDRVTEGS